MSEKKIMLHICCGPCATHVLEELKNNFTITGFFYNPNIYPVDECEKRMNELIKLKKFIPFDLYFGNYDYERWYDLIKDFEDEEEGGQRCEKCIRFRIEQTAEKAVYYKIPFIATTLSISPHKNTQMINSIGKEVAEKYRLTFIAEDFKKNNGYAKSIELSKKYALYRQKYCGCRFSARL